MARVLLLGVAFRCGTAAAVALGSEAHSFNPLAVYGDEHRFAVLRDGTAAGEHIVRFRETADGLVVETAFTLKVNFLFFSAYRYAYQATAIWRNRQLQHLVAVTNDDGEVFRVSARRQPDGRLLVSGPKGDAEAPNGILPTHHWNPAVIDADAVLNTITGRVNWVVLEFVGVETVNVAGGAVHAHHYRTTGDLENEVWYDAHGRWVRMRFRAKDGSTIDYVCQTCVPTTAEAT